MPRKIHLKLEALAVDSFETGTEPKGTGTVRGLAATSPADPCFPPPTALQTCARKQTNYASCVAYCECTDMYRACLA
jgi:hypothetical protein